MRFWKPVKVDWEAVRNRRKTDWDDRLDPEIAALSEKRTPLNDEFAAGRGADLAEHVAALERRIARLEER